MAGNGRPTKLTPKKKKVIIEAVERGNYIETAAALAGVSKVTVYNWKNRGEAESKRLNKYPDAEVDKKEKPFFDFFNAYTRALAVAEDLDVQNINQAAKDDWRASAWKLERRNPEKWGKRDKLEADLQHSGKDGGPIETKSKFDLSNLSSEELALLASIVRRNRKSE